MTTPPTPTIPDAALDAAADALSKSPGYIDGPDAARKDAHTALEAGARAVAAQALRDASRVVSPDPRWECFAGTPEDGRLGAAQDLVRLADELEGKL